MIKNLLSIVLFSTVFLFTLNSSYAQGSPCDASGPGCQSGGGDMIVSSLQDTVDANKPFNIGVGAGVKSNGKVDTSYSGTITLSKVSGPGNLKGPLSLTFSGFGDMPNIELDSIGTYKIEFDLSGIGKDTVTVVAVGAPSGGGGGGTSTDLCDTGAGGPGCQNTGGDAVYVRYNDTVEVGKPFQIVVAVKNKASGKIDTTQNVNASVTSLNSADTLKMGGSLTAFKWVEWNNLEVSTTNTTMQIIVDVAGIGRDTITVHVLPPSGGGGGGGTTTGCIKSSSGTRENLGLYGGASIDLSFNNSGRLFGAIETPNSLFISDDTASTWYPAFPFDSLEYDCGRGWGGRAMRVLTNQNGWVGTQTVQQSGTLSAAVINFHDGDTGMWTTAADSKLLLDAGISGQGNIAAIDLNDYYMYVGTQGAIVRIDSNGIDVSNIISFGSLGLPVTSVPISIAATNDPSGFPMYIVVDTAGNQNATFGIMYKYDGATASMITPPGGVDGISSVYTSLGHITGDTLYINSMTGTVSEVWHSKDQAATWGSSIYTGTFGLSDVDFLPGIKGVKGDGTVLIMPGQAVSFDLGATWEVFQLSNNGNAVYPNNADVILGTKGRGVAISTSGAAGPFNVAKNFELEAVKIKQIAHTEGKGVFYVATKAGLAYTSAYLNAGISNFDKWNTPYGEFPVAGAGDDAGVSSVAIDPSDSTHVIAGYSNGFILTTTGHTGFSNVQPSSWNSGQQDPAVHDIKFVSSSIVIAVTGGENQNHSQTGNIYRSTDGGASWAQVTPANFSNGNAIAINNGSTNTIYVGAGLEQGTHADDLGALWKSTDDGASWAKVNSGPSNHANTVTDLPILDLVVSSSSADTLYVAAGSNLDHAFAYSHDGGASYTTTTISGEGAFSSVMMNQIHEDTLYVAIRRELYLYDAKNDSARLVYRGLPGEIIPDLVWGSILMGSSTGAYKIEIEFEDIVTRVDEFSMKNNSMTLYPNPSNGNVIVSMKNNLSSLSNIKVYSLMGSEAYSADYNRDLNVGDNVQLNLSSLAKGTYYIVVTGENEQFTGKLVLMK